MSRRRTAKQKGYDMSLRSVRFLTAALAITVSSASAWAQTSARAEGWPGATPAASARKTATVVRVVHSVAHRAAPAAAPVRTPATVPTIAAPPASSSTADLVAALESQSALLQRLASELQADRLVVDEHQRTIQTLRQQLADAPAVAARASAPAPPPPITVDTSGAKLRIGGLVQAWFTAGTSTIDTFRIRRTELKLAGDLSPAAHWTLVVDPTKSGSVLQDAFVTLQRSSAFGLDVGQQKIPLGYEGFLSSSKLPTFDRALFVADKARGGGYGDVRDLGAVARGTVAGGQVDYAAGLFNGLGESQNDVDKNVDKAIAARVAAQPRAFGGVQVGASFARGAFVSTAETRRDREGLDAGIVRGRVRGRAELMIGHDGIVTRRGYYALGGVQLFAPVEAVFRADVFDPDTRTEATKATVTERDWLAGLNWRLSPQAVLLQINYVRKTFGSADEPRHVVLANLQTAW